MSFVSCFVTSNLTLPSYSSQSYIWGGQENPALVEKMDIKCDNGYIHVIDAVLIPYEGVVAPIHN